MMWKWMAGAGLGVGIATLFRSQYERKQLDVEVIPIGSEKIKGEKNLVFLSDLHDNEFGPDNVRLLAAIDQINPQAVLIGGDMMVCKKKCETKQALKLLEVLASKYPVYYGNGNHESRMRWKKQVYKDVYDKYRDRLKEMGIHHLVDDHADLGDHITVHGLDIGRSYYDKGYRGEMGPGYLEGKLGTADPGQFHLLLAHSPLFFDAYRRWGADLTLSGHFHGGTIRLPFLGGLMTPQFHFFLPWCGGFFEKNKHYMVVSRGLGTHSINIRLNNKPQLVVIRLEGLK